MSLGKLKPMMLRGGVWGAMAIGVWKATKSMISASKEIEDLETQFKSLLGSRSKAQERIKEISEIASKTPFELGELSRASRILETLTKGALSTGEGLKLVGDASASTGSDFENLAIWVGRAYDGLQANRPVGEAMMRMQELGLVSGETRNQIEKLQKVGKGREAWKLLEAELQKTKGAMADLSQTATGLESTTRDLVKQMWRNADASIGLSNGYKKALHWGIQLLNNMNEHMEHDAYMERIKDTKRFATGLLNLAKIERAQAQRMLGLRTIDGKLAKKMGDAVARFKKNAIAQGKTELWIEEQKIRKSLGVFKGLKATNKLNKEQEQIANDEIERLTKKLMTIEKINKEEQKSVTKTPKKSPAEIEAELEADKKKSDAIRNARKELERLVADQKSWKSEVIGMMDDLDRRNRKRASRPTDQMGMPTQPQDQTKKDADKKRLDDAKRFFQGLRELNEIARLEREQETGLILADSSMRADAQLQLLEQQYARERAMYQKHNKDMSKLDDRYAQRKRNIINATAKFQVGALANAGTQIVGNLKTIFGETKALAVAEATIKGIQASVNSFEFGTKLGGPILGGIMAGLSATATAVQIGKMKSQNFATGGFPTGANASVTMNERGQESVLNASATARLGRENINRLNRGQDMQNEGGNTQPSSYNVTYNPTYNLTGLSDSNDILSILEDDKERFGNMISELNRKGYVNV